MGKAFPVKLPALTPTRHSHAHNLTLHPRRPSETTTMLARRTRSKGNNPTSASAPSATKPDGLGLLRLAALLQPATSPTGAAIAPEPSAAQLERAMRTVGLADFEQAAAGWARCYRPTRIP
jgi:hypothetical protein